MGWLQSFHCGASLFGRPYSLKLVSGHSWGSDPFLGLELGVEAASGPWSVFFRETEIHIQLSVHPSISLYLH